MDTFSKQGLSHLRNALDLRLVDLLKESIKAFIKQAVSNLSVEDRDYYLSKKFDGDNILHQGLLLLHQLDNKQFQYVIDAASNCINLHLLVNADCVLKQVKTLIKSKSVHSIVLTQPRLRVDLPEKFSLNKKKIHLGFHQESSYFKKNVSQKTAIVSWIPLFDCNEKRGALKFLAGSNNEGELKHKIWFEDEANKKHKRATVSDCVIKKYSEQTLDAKVGDLIFQKFDLIHRSGDNQTDDHVRYTIVARYSDGVASDFLPVSF
ncbi:MAG: ectoine hydroxylase-related dioxygenase (phytanoyl-CoA dioxygenase family) [Paraglaciecola sp.]